MNSFSSVCLSLTLMGSSLLAVPKKVVNPVKPKAPVPAATGHAAPAAPGAAGHAAPKPSPTATMAAPEPASEPVMSSGGGGEGSYGVAGCGLGSQIIKSKDKFPQIAASFLNVTGMQTVAITLGTSNCGHSKSEVAAAEQKVFIIANLSSLSREAAQGGGEHLDGLAEMFGCNGESTRLRLGQMSQEKFHDIFANKKAEVILEHYRSAIHADPLLGSSCQKAG